MVRELEILVLTFGGSASHTRCFLHVVNLIAKMLIRQFDVRKGEADSALEDTMELEELSQGMDKEEPIGVGQDFDSGEAGKSANENDGWVDEREELDEDERHALNKAIRPIKMALVKVSWTTHTFGFGSKSPSSFVNWHTKLFIRLPLFFLPGRASCTICR